MSQKSKFTAPFKSPGEAKTSRATSSGNQMAHSEQKSDDSCFASPWSKDGSTAPGKTPKTPSRTPVFRLYGVKSPYRRGRVSREDNTPGRMKYFTSSQASSPGISPARLIKNFSEKMKQKEPRAVQANDLNQGVDPLSERKTQEEVTNPSPVMHPTTKLPEVAVTPAAEKPNYTGVQEGSIKQKERQKREDEYDMDISLEHVDNHKKLRKQNRGVTHKQNIKHVLASLQKMHKEFTDYQKKYELLRRRNLIQDLQEHQSVEEAPMLSVELMYSCTQSQVVTSQRRKLYSEAEVVVPHSLTQGDNLFPDPSEE